MKNSEIKIVFNRLKNYAKQTGYINLNHRLVNTDEDLIEIASIFRDPRFETFRLIYTKNNEIVGYESICSKLPNKVDLVDVKRKHLKSPERCFQRAINQMNRLQADGYYLVHNHTSGECRPSRDDIRTTEKFKNKVKGFKGHLILGFEKYSWVDIDDNGKLFHQDDIFFDKKIIKNLLKKLNSNSIYNQKITSRIDLIAIVQHLVRKKEHSTVILTNGQGGIRMVLDFPNSFLNQDVKQLNNYFKNISKEIGATRVFFATEFKESYEKAKKHQIFGTLKDCIYYENKEDRIVLKNSDTIEVKNDLFEKSLVVDCKTKEVLYNEFINQVLLKEDKLNYKVDNENFEKSKEKIRIVLKKVGKKPKVEEIENTLEAKQELVDGLIEVIPFYNIEDVLLICNEEGKLDDLKPNIMLDYDCIVGDCFFIGDDYENADFKSITDEQIKEVEEFLEHRSFEYSDEDLER